MSQDYEQLEQLLLHKDFEQLSPQEQIWVQKRLSKAAYRHQRHLLLQSQQWLQTTAPKSSSQLAALQAKLQQQHQKSFVDYIQTPIALYQAALVAALVGVIIWWCRPIAIQTITEPPQVIYKTQIDTIVQEKIVVKEKIIYKTKTISLPVKVDTVYLDFADQPSYYQDKTTTAPTKSTGKSLKETRQLMDFVMETN